MTNQPGQQKCDAGNLTYQIYPQHYRCVNCGQFWLAYEPEPICNASLKNQPTERPAPEEWEKRFDLFWKEEAVYPKVRVVSLSRDQIKVFIRAELERYGRECVRENDNLWIKQEQTVVIPNAKLRGYDAALDEIEWEVNKLKEFAFGKGDTWYRGCLRKADVLDLLAQKKEKKNQEHEE